MKRLLPAGLLLLCLLPAQASAAGLGEVIRALESPFKTGAATPVRDVQADFFQESHIAALDRTQRGRGTVSFRFVPGNGNRAPQVMFNWQYEEPSRQEIVSDGKTMWVYIPDNMQVVESDISNVGRANATNPVTFLSGLGNLSRDFTIMWGNPDTDSEGNYILRLRPQRPSPLIREMILIVDRDAVQGQGAYFPILSSTVIDQSENRTTIEFRDLRVNRGLTALDFNFMMPPGVDVVRPTGAEMGF